MTSVTINANVLTEDGKLHGSAAPDGSRLPILLGRLDISMVADGVDLKGSAATTANWVFDHINSTIKKYTEADEPYIRAVYNDDLGINASSWPSAYFFFPTGTAPQELYFQFYARRNGAGGGCKFVKAFDKNNGTAYYSISNTTWNNNYPSSDIGALIFGDGAGPQNDSNMALGYGGGVGGGPIRFPSQNVLPRTFHTGSGWTAAEWGDGTQWHKWQMRVKLNSGTSLITETNDGIYEVWIDGVLRCGAWNIMNRHFDSQGWNKIEFLSYMQGVLGFTLDMKNITISQHGWID